MGTKKLVRTASRKQRLKVIQELLVEVVFGIRSVQDFLEEQQAGDETNGGYLTRVAMGRVGWIAEQCLTASGYKPAPLVGSAEAWLLERDNILGELSRIRYRALHPPA